MYVLLSASISLCVFGVYVFSSNTATLCCVNVWEFARYVHWYTLSPNWQCSVCLDKRELVSLHLFFIPSAVSRCTHARNPFSLCVSSSSSFFDISKLGYSVWFSMQIKRTNNNGDVIKIEYCAKKKNNNQRKAVDFGVRVCLVFVLRTVKSAF